MTHLSCRGLAVLLILFALAASIRRADGRSSDVPATGDLVDLTQYGRRTLGQDFIAVEWDEPREVYEVCVEDIDSVLVEKLRLAWWGSVWPAYGTGGWMRMDDPWNGRWITVDAKAEQTGDRRFVLRFPALAKTEWENVLPAGQYPDKKAPVFRRTLKVRLRAENQRIDGSPRLGVFGCSRWCLGRFDIETRHSPGQQIHGQLELINGELLRIEPMPRSGQVEITGARWIGKGPIGGLPAGSKGSTGVQIQVLYADNNDLNSNELTRVTVHFGEQPQAAGFSFVPQDVIQQGVIRLSDFGTLVSESRRGVTIANDPGPGQGCWRHPVRKRIPEQPEMTREMAMAGIPRLAPARWVPLGVPSARQEFFVGPNGDWMITALSLNTDTGRDAKRWVFKKDFGN